MQPAINLSFDEYLKYASASPSWDRWSCHFAIQTLDGKHIGNCSYFDIDEVSKEAEIAS